MAENENKVEQVTPEAEVKAEDQVEKAKAPEAEVKTEDQAEEAKAPEVQEEKKVEVEKDPLERKLELSISRETMDKEVARGLRAKGRKARFHGFRPGKAPASMVAAAYGLEVQNEVINNLVSEALAKKIEDEKIKFVAWRDVVPDNSKPADDNQLHFIAYIEVYPDVEVPSVKDLDVVQYECQLTDENVEKTIDVMRNQRATYKKVDRAAEDGDQVVLDYKGTLDGKPFEGGSNEDVAFILGSGRMLPEFEKAVRGLKAGESKTFPLTFPENYVSKELAGKETSFEIKIKEVNAKVLPEVNDEFARSLGIKEGVEKMKADILDNLQREVAARTQAKTKQNVMDALLSVAKFPVPQALVQKDCQRRIEEFEEQAKLYNHGRDLETPVDLITAQAEKSVRLGLLLSAIIEKEGITATEDQIKALAENIAKSYEDPEKVVEWYMKDPSREGELRAVAMENNVVDWVLKNAKVKKETVNFETLMSQQV